MTTTLLETLSMSPAAIYSFLKPRALSDIASDSVNTMYILVIPAGAFKAIEIVSEKSK